MISKKFVFISALIVLFLLISKPSLRAQEIPDDNNGVIIDSIDQRENLLDSNEIYKKQFDSLAKEGEWLKMKKSDFVRDLDSLTGEELDFPDDYDGDLYFWRPYCETGFWNPYYNGRWVFSVYGWLWLSDYNWGWGPYNYGRWYFSGYYGWVWLPGCTWAANWVTWRCNNSYYGWYPTCPSIHWVNNGHWYSNHKFASGPPQWVFVKRENFTSTINSTTTVHVNENGNILKTTTKVPSSVYVDPGMPKIKYNGPDVKQISEQTGQKIVPKNVEISNTGGKQFADGNTISTYRRDNTNTVKDGSKKTNTGTYHNSTRNNTRNGNHSTKSGTTTKSKSNTRGTKGTKNSGKQHNGNTKSYGGPIGDYTGSADNSDSKNNSSEQKSDSNNSSDSKSNDSKSENSSRGSFDSWKK